MEKLLSKIHDYKLEGDKYRLDKDVVVTEAEIEKFHNCDDWPANRNPKKRPNQAERKKRSKYAKLYMQAKPAKPKPLIVRSVTVSRQVTQDGANGHQACNSEQPSECRLESTNHNGANASNTAFASAEELVHSRNESKTGCVQTDKCAATEQSKSQLSAPASSGNFKRTDGQVQEKKYRVFTSKGMSYTDADWTPMPKEPSSAKGDGDWFDRDCSRSLRPNRSLKTETGSETPLTLYEESCQLYENTAEYKKQPHQFDVNILKTGIHLEETYITNVSSGKPKTNEFYSSSNDYNELQSYCDREPNRYKKCVIDIQSAHLAICTPIDKDDKIRRIEINGRSKCKQAFSEDLVVVRIINVHQENDESQRRNLQKGKKEAQQIVYGEVVGILEKTRFRNIHNPVFVCVLDENEGHLMKPLCKTVPKINIFHSKVLNKYPQIKKHKVECYKYNESSGRLHFEKYYNINPAERMTYVFIVVYISWNPRTIYPIGAVIDVHRFNDNIEAGLKLVGWQCQVPSLYKQETIQQVRALQDESNMSTPLQLEKDRMDISESTRAFTIDPPNAKDLDDALSVQQIDENIVEVAIHIADVSQMIKKGDPLDKEAKERATTFYPGQTFRAYHMLPEPLSQGLCSLLPEQKRPAISVFARFDSNGMLASRPEIRKTLVKSVRQLTYKEAQDMLTASPVPNDPIAKDMKTLYEVAKKLRTIRLKGAFCALPVEVEPCIDEDSYLQNLQAHRLVEEFMIIANTAIGRLVKHHYPDCALIRCQDPPSEDEVKGWLNEHPYIADILVQLQNRKIRNTRELSVENAPNERWRSVLSFQKWVWEGITSAVKDKRFDIAWRYIAMDELHPEQALALRKWFSFQDTAEYRCSGDVGLNGDLHFTLGIENYTHFTSPIRRYSDLVVHRQVHSILDKSHSKYSKQEMIQLCCHMNAASKRSKDYQKMCKTLSLSHRLKKNPKMFNGFVEEISETGVLVTFPELTFVPKFCREVLFSALDLSSKPVISTWKNRLRPKENGKQNETNVTWQKRVYCYERSTKKKEQTAGMQNIDPNQRAIFIKYADFIPILKSLLSIHGKLLLDTMENMQNNDKEESSEQRKTWFYPKVKLVQDATSEVNTGLIVNHRLDLKMSINISQILGIQMCAEPRSGLLVPTAQFLDITQNIKCCLSHISNPVKALSKYATSPAKSTYSTIYEYRNIWLPILEMESASNAIEDTVTINNVPVKFKERQGIFSHNTKYFDERDIDFKAMSSDFLKDIDEENENEGDRNNDDEYKTQCCNDYLCMRIPLPASGGDQGRQCTTYWLAHASITKLRQRGTDKKSTSAASDEEENKNEGERDKQRVTDIVFRLHEDAPDPPMAYTENCSIDILFKNQVDRRTECYIKMINDASPLVKCIAQGKEMPELDEVHLEVARSMPLDIDCDNLPRNNAHQNRAIKKALNSSFCLIQGPPGTGKTLTGIKLLCIFNEFNQKLAEATSTEKKKIVFCGPSNKSVDLVARWMKEKLGDKSPKMIRMYGNAYERLDFPVPCRASMSSKTLRNFSIDEKLKSSGLILHWAIRQKDKPFADKLRMFDAEFRQFINKKRKMGITMRKLNAYKNILVKAKREELKQYDVIFCTTSVAASPNFLKTLKGRVYQCIIDESAMCTDPETLVPMIGTQATQVVLIGDHKQLRPVVKCRMAAELGLEKSLFERYAEMDKYIVMLCLQYRMNKFICQFPSEAFYEGKLQTEKSPIWLEKKPLTIWKRLTNVENPYLNHVPHIFCHVEGEEEVLPVSTEEGNEQSRSNMAEVDQVLKVFKHLVKNEGVDPTTINVISQYNAQCHALKAAFKSHEFQNVNVNTVFSSQGGEWDYVIFSLVRSIPEFLIEKTPTIGWCLQNLGFITDKNQINVALTRARKGLILIGNKNLLQCDQVWRELIKSYSELDCVVNGDSFPVEHKGKKGSGRAVGTTSHIPSEGTTSDTQSEGTTSDTQSEETTSDTQSEGTTSDTQSEGTTSDTQSEGTTSDTQSEGTTSDTPSEGTTSDTQSEGTTSDTPSEGTTSDTQSEGTTSDTPSEGTTVLYTIDK